MLRSFSTLSIAAVVLVLPVAAQAIPVNGGASVTEFTNLPAGLNVTGATAFGQATVLSTSPITVNQPLTGGDVTNINLGQINAFASGVNFQLSGGNTLGLSNFQTQLDFHNIVGDITYNGGLIGGSVSLFNFKTNSVSLAAFQDVANPTLKLTIATGLSNALTAQFGLPSTKGSFIGLYATNPLLGDNGSSIPAPEPTAMALFGLSLLGLGALRRRR